MAIKFTTATPKPLVEAWPDSARPLPPFVRDYIESGAPEGMRNDTIFKVAQQFHACGYSVNEAETYIVRRAIADGGVRFEGEARQAIKSAFRSTLVTEPITLAAGGHSGTAAASKKPEPGFIQALRAAFLPGESIAVVESKENDAGEWKPSVATIKTLEQWEGWHAKMGDINRLFAGTAGGAFIGINPVKAGSQVRSNDNVAAFRHVLVEWDKDMPLAEQASKIESSGLPVSVMLSSGGKSVHAWVRVDAKDADEWRSRRDFLFEQFKCDEKNKDLARVSRCPGAMRGDKEQKVLAVGLGPKSWAEWEQRNEWVPESFGVYDLVEKGPEPPPEVIKGVLRRGCVMQISSGPKMRKSYLLIDLAFSVQAGIPWLGLETNPGPVFYLDAENQAALIRERLPKVAKARGVKLSAAINDRFRICPLRWRLKGKSLPDIVQGVTRAMRAMPVPPVLAILEPLYLLLRGAKEKEAEEVTQALEELDELCREVGCAIAFVHHFSKGSQTGKASMDRASGSGALSRFPDAIVTLTPPDEPKSDKQAKPDWQATVGMDLRWFPPVPEFKVWWKGDHYSPSPATTFKTVSKFRPGSYADKYGTQLSNMPPLKRHRSDPTQCEVTAWCASALKLDMKEAWNVFDALRGKEYDFVSGSGDGMWCGTDYEPESPIIDESSSDDDIPF